MVFKNFWLKGVERGTKLLPNSYQVATKFGLGSDGRFFVKNRGYVSTLG